MAIRRAVAAVAGGMLVLEGIGIAGVQWVMAEFLDRQHMSMGGVDHGVMANSLRIGGTLFGVYLLLCGVAALLTGVRDQAPGRLVRVLLISAAVVHGVLGMLTVGLVGWDAFTLLMVVLGLIVFTLVSYGRAGEPRSEPVAGPAEPPVAPAAP